MMEENKLPQTQLHILQHSLGVDQYGQGRRFRNHYVAGGEDLILCRELAASGFMKENPSSALTDGCPLFRVTPAGVHAVELQSPAPPKVSRSKQRYQDYLDADCCETFGEWLKQGRWKKAA